MSENTFMTYEYESAYGGTETLSPYLNIYANNGNICLGFRGLSKEDGFWGPFCIATVNTVSLAYLEGAIDVNDNGNRILDFLEANGFGQRTPYAVASGFCIYPIFQFNEDKLRQIDPEVFAEYAKAFGKTPPTLEEKIQSAEKKAKAPHHQGAKELER